MNLARYTVLERCRRSNPEHVHLAIHRYLERTEGLLPQREREWLALGAVTRYFSLKAQWRAFGFLPPSCLGDPAWRLHQALLWTGLAHRWDELFSYPNFYEFLRAIKRSVDRETYVKLATIYGIPAQPNTTSNRKFTKGGTYYANSVWCKLLVDKEHLGERPTPFYDWQHRIDKATILRLEEELHSEIDPNTLFPFQCRYRAVHYVRYRLATLLGRKVPMGLPSVAWFLNTSIVHPVKGKSFRPDGSLRYVSLRELRSWRWIITEAPGLDN